MSAPVAAPPALPSACFVDDTGVLRPFEFSHCIWDELNEAQGRRGAELGARAPAPASVCAHFRDVSRCRVSLDAGGSLVLVAASADEDGAWFSHAACCPARAMAHSAGARDTSRPAAVRVGVAAVIEDERGRVLLTQRAAAMRSFPGAWVVPGGHLERTDASIAAAGLRETLEETGCAVDASSARVLGVWESCFPIDLSLGPPVRQHVVVYISARTASSGAPLRLQASEVAAAAWLPAADVARLVSGDVAEGDIVAGDASSGGAGAAAADAPSHVPCSLYDMHTRLAEGSRFALALWAAAAGAAAESKY